MLSFQPSKLALSTIAADGISIPILLYLVIALSFSNLQCLLPALRSTEYFGRIEME